MALRNEENAAAQHKFVHYQRKTAGGMPRRPFLAPALRRMAIGLEFQSDGLERFGNVTSERRNSADDNHGDQGGNQSVLNRRDSAAVNLQFVQFHSEGGADVVHEHSKNPFRW